MNTLEIIFTGIVYLLGTADSTGGTVQAILPAVVAPIAPYGEIIPEHVAYIKVKASDLSSPPAEPPTFKYKQFPANEEYFIYVLGTKPDSAGDAISITPSAFLPDVLTICKADPCLNNRLSYNNFVAHREEICPKCGPIDPSFMKSPISDLVAARMEIKHGYLAAAKRLDNNSWPKWHIKPAHGPALPIKAQQLSERVSLDVSANGPISIVVAPLDNTSTPRYELKLVNNASIEIGNTPVADIVLPSRTHDEPVDHHFGLFYTMLQSAPANPPVPTKPAHATLGPRDNCPPLADEGGN
jgi:hypothetical protein